MRRWLIPAALAAVAVVCVAVLLAGYDAQHEPAPAPLPAPIESEYAPVWVLEDNGTWTCTPAGFPECNCALPPHDIGPRPAVVNEPWTCDALEATP